MVKIAFANHNYIDIISEFEKNNFYGEAYSFDTINDMLKDNYILKDNDNIFIALDNDELVGYIIFHIQSDFTDIYKIFVREKDRRNGIAQMMLLEVEKLSKRYNSKKIMIEVREKNINAINLYNKFGMENIDIRKNYYNNPTDNALIFKKELGE